MGRDPVLVRVARWLHADTKVNQGWYAFLNVSLVVNGVIGLFRLIEVLS